MSVLVVVLPLLVLGLVVLPLRRSPQVAVTVGDGLVHVHLGLSDKLYCCRGDLHLPVDAVEGVAVWPREQLPATGLRLPGTSLWGVIGAGSYRPAGLADAHATARGLQPILGSYTGSLS